MDAISERGDEVGQHFNVGHGSSTFLNISSHLYLQRCSERLSLKSWENLSSFHDATWLTPSAMQLIRDPRAQSVTARTASAGCRASAAACQAYRPRQQPPLFRLAQKLLVMCFPRLLIEVHVETHWSAYSPTIRSGGPPHVLTRRTPVPTPERTASADGYPSACTFCTCVLPSDCRLRHSGSLERDSSPTGTFPTEWPGSQQERHVGVKHSWSRKNASCSASLGKNGALVSCPGEATSLGGLCQGLP